MKRHRSTTTKKSLYALNAYIQGYFRITGSLGLVDLGVVKPYFRYAENKQRIGYAWKLRSTLVDISISSKK